MSNRVPKTSVGDDSKGRRGLYRIDAGTGDVRLLQGTDGRLVLDVFPSSPKGLTVLFARDDAATKSRVISIQLPGTEQERDIIRVVSPARIVNTALSPDGQQIAFDVIDPSTQSKTLKVVSVSGGEPRELWKEPELSHFFLLAWTADNHLFVVKGPRGGAELWRISATGGEPRKVGPTMKNIRFLRLHPDGKRLTFTAGTNEFEVWAIDNFLPAAQTQKTSVSRR